MIDLHCHLLPGIDDGPQSMEESLALAALAVRNGITHVIATPHIHPGRWNNDRFLIARLCNRLRLRLAYAGIPLTVGMAAEVRVDSELIRWLAQDKIPFLGQFRDKRALLLELPHSHIPLGTENLITWLLQRNIQPVLAHPERNKDVIRRLDNIMPLVRCGGLLQITAGSITGHFGKPAQRRAKQLLELDAVFAIATDAHNCRNRPPVLMQGRDAAEHIVGSERAHQLVTTHPMQLAGSQFSTQRKNVASIQQPHE
jgi:protein-tyrosine phosphatase